MINHELLSQFASKGLTINEGVVIDARLVKSASHPLSQQKLEDEKKKRETPEGKLDKNGNILKFSRDLESVWTVKALYYSIISYWCLSSFSRDPRN